MSRFRLDPRGAPPPALPPAPGPAPLPRAPPPPAPVSAAIPAPATGKRRVIILAAIAVGVLLVGGAVAVLVVTSGGYPDAYILSRSEMPSGMTNARLSANDMEDFGITSNPGEMDPAMLESEFEQRGGDSPERGHVQVLAAGSSRIVILVFEYATKEDAERAASNDGQARAICRFANGAALRDGDVLVTVIPDGSAGRTEVRSVTAELRAQNRGLSPVCGA